jgi:FkbM family methyltransferase
MSAPVKLEQFAGNGRMVTDNRAIYAKVPLPDKRRVALDIGAFTGEWTRLLAEDFRNVIAFEVRENSREKFRQNKPPNATIMDVGLGDRPGMVEFVLRGVPGGGRYAQHPGLGRQGEREILPVMNLDSFNLDEVDLMKIDVDGFEKAVLYGGLETIWRNKPVIVIEIKFMSTYGKYDLLRLIDYERVCQISPIDEVWVARG